MNTLPLQIDERLSSAIRAIEIYAEIFDDLGWEEKASSCNDALSNLKVVAYDAAAYEANQRTMGGINLPASVTEEDDIMSSFEPVSWSDDAAVCNRILKEAKNNIEGFTDTTTMRGPHTVWLAQVRPLYSVERSNEPDFMDVIIDAKITDDGLLHFLEETVHVCKFSPGYIRFLGNHYHPDWRYD